MMNTTRWRGSLSGLLLALWAFDVGAAELTLPAGARQSFSTVQDPGAYALPTGAWARGQLPVRRVEGRVEVAAWHIPDNAASPFQLAKPLRDALVADGFEILLDCRARACGGFDFRFATLVLPAPEMFVDLTAFHFISAVSEDGGAVSILTSRDSRQGYVQIIRAGGAASGKISAPGGAAAPAPAVPRPSVNTDDLIAALETQGHVILRDLVFKPGSTSLGGGSVASLDRIAAYLAANPKRQILFVGHTDATGSLDANRSISNRRAQAAVAYLRERHRTPSAQIGAQGVGYLSPVASNLTTEGREANRRVEAVLISTE
ncbi:OmpA family protein [Antarctobacter jejuensis]|uniref:OmpA family protein n=1 Tax=Antarctobacter jejuensis TaxID=1439938 RepID=UPI003FCF0C4E